MDRKQFLNLAGVSVAAAATSGIAGCVGQASAATKSMAPVKGPAARARRAVYVPNGRNRFDSADDLGCHPVADQGLDE